MVTIFPAINLHFQELSIDMFDCRRVSTIVQTFTNHHSWSKVAGCIRNGPPIFTATDPAWNDVCSGTLRSVAGGAKTLER